MKTFTSVSGAYLTLKQLQKDREDLLVAAMPVMLVISHVPISAVKPENYLVQEEVVLNPHTEPKSAAL